MSNKKLVDLIKKMGYLFPETEDEIIQFESNMEIYDNHIYCFNKPNEIINNGHMKIDKLKEPNISNEELQKPSMAAREGKDITSDVRKKMKEDRDNARKK